jgi:UDP-N-acetylmuramate dehydrogenase
MLWPKSLSKKIKKNVLLSALTSFKIGGRAEYFFQPKTVKDLREILVFTRRQRIRVFILGAGSNILVSQEGLPGLVIKLSSKNFEGCVCKGSCIIAGSSLKLNKLIAFATSRSLSGLEFLSGIPGSLGGAVAGNAGAWGQSIGPRVMQAGVLDYSGKQKILTAKQLKFTYRSSNLHKYIIIWVKLGLNPAQKNAIQARIREYLLSRRKSQGDRLPNAGCIFKNPPGGSAGRLIDLCGLKGRRRGQAMISTRHANFILNTGNAGSNDVLSLMELMQNKVRQKFRVTIEPEIKIWK